MEVSKIDGQAMDEGILSLTQLLGYHTDSQSLIQLPPNPISPEILTCTRMSDDDGDDEDLGADDAVDGQGGEWTS